MGVWDRSGTVSALPAPTEREMSGQPRALPTSWHQNWTGWGRTSPTAAQCPGVLIRESRTQTHTEGQPREDTGRGCSSTRQERGLRVPGPQPPLGLGEMNPIVQVHGPCTLLRQLQLTNMGFGVTEPAENLAPGTNVGPQQGMRSGLRTQREGENPPAPREGET